MKNLARLAFAAVLALTCVLPSEAKISDLLPRPKNIQAKNGSPFVLGREVALNDPTNNKMLKAFLAETGCTESNVAVADADAATAVIEVAIVDTIDKAFNHNVPLFPDEAYAIDVTENRIAIKALTPLGVTRAAQTLCQLAEGYDGTPAIEALSMTDWPAFKVRGFMHDVGRSFLPVEELKTEIDRLARFKVNVFHWHLTEKLAWRFEVKAYPQLTADANMTRYPGQYYTQDDCREIEAYAAERGMTVIPEIDMPGHSDVFTKAMGFSMQTDQGVEALKNILDEVVEVFPNAPYIHIGGDEVTITYTDFLKIMANYVRGKGKKVVMWNRLVAGPPSAEQCDMTQMWATAGKVVKGLPNIDCRYNYTNHFDVYADVVGIYKSNIYYAQEGTADIAGTISAAWNDTKTPNDTAIVVMNNIYANILASAERAWCGGGKQYIEVGGTTLPVGGDEYEEFADWERRFLFHKAHSLADVPIPYVKQTNVRWRITDAFPNGGDPTKVFPPETTEADVLPDVFTYEGQQYGCRTAAGAGIYLRHIWHPTVPSFFSAPADNQTAYAWTYVYSPKAQKAGAQIEFYTYSRSGSETAPPAGKWDRRGSRIWLNDAEIPAPVWEQPDASIPQDNATLELKNENLTARPVTQVELKEGWNKVFLKLPHANKGGTGRDKWQFTFVLTDTTGVNALDGIRYSATKCIDDEADNTAAVCDSVAAVLRASFNDAPGWYKPELAEPLYAQIEQVRGTLAQALDGDARAAQQNALREALATLLLEAQTAGINQPKASTDEAEVWYAMNTPLRDGRYLTAHAAGEAVTGETAKGKTAMWKFQTRTDGTFDILSSKGLYISPASANNTALTLTATVPTSGWTISETDALGYVKVTSGSVQFNQTKAAQSYQLFNWGSGTNTTDPGCKFRMEEVEMPPSPILSTADADTICWMQFYTPARESRYPTAVAAGQPVMGETVPTAASTWAFVKRADGSIDIKNRAIDGYIAPNTTNNSALIFTTNQPSTGWSVQEVGETGQYIIVCGEAQFNQTNAGNGYKVFNWGGGTNTTDAGCLYAFKIVETVVNGISQTALQPTNGDYGAWYDLSGRRVSQPAKGVYFQAGRKVILR